MVTKLFGNPFYEPAVEKFLAPPCSSHMPLIDSETEKSRKNKLLIWWTTARMKIILFSKFTFEKYARAFFVTGLVSLGSSCFAQARPDYDSISGALTKIYEEDQMPRRLAEDYERDFGVSSKKYRQLLSQVHDGDSVHMVCVENIISQYGWLNKKLIGERANKTLFLVIQHSNKETRMKYLPVMRKAVKDGNADPASFALLEDRVRLENGKKQIYGSQIGIDRSTGSPVYFVRPLMKPNKVDERRRKMGMTVPMKQYAKLFGIDWDPVKYKSSYEEILKMERRLQYKKTR
jgi:hypothetical protein